MTTKPFIDPDAGKGPEQLLAERTRRLQDAMQLKQPDRVPIQMSMSYMLADMYGVSHQEQHENPQKEIKAQTIKSHAQAVNQSCGEIFMKEAAKKCP